MRVRCKHVDRSCYEDRSITVGNEYEVLYEHGSLYCIIDDRDKQEYHFKFRFEIIKEDKMEEIKIVRKLEDLDGLENGMGATAVYDEVNKRVRIRTKEECLGIGIAYSDEYSDLDGFLTVMKVIGFKFEYKPSRSLEEVVAEMRTKEIQFTFNGDNWYVKHVASYNKYYVSYDCHDNIIGTIYLDKETAAKYCIELNEILKGGK